MRRLSITTTLAIAVGCLMVGGLTAVAVGAISAGTPDGPPATTVVGTPTEAIPTAGATPPASIDTTVSSQFAVFRRAADPIRDATAPLARPEIVHQLGVNIELARQVPGGRSPITVAPAAGTLCLSSGASSACPSIDSALAGHAAVVELCSPAMPAGTVRVYGLLPDGASDVRVVLRTGAPVSVSLDDGIYAVESQSVPDRLAWNQNGTPQELALPVPADAQAELDACRQ